jgi:S1-C subfamily serine protease
MSDLQRSIESTLTARGKTRLHPNFPTKRLAVKAIRWRKPEIFNGLLISACLLAALTALSCQAQNSPVLNEIEARHEAVHAAVAPAVVAVQTPGGRQNSIGVYGTGVVISASGLILTSSTVVPAGSKMVQVFFSDGRVMDARVVSTDEATEACVLEAVQEGGRKPLAFVEMADSAKCAVGELAYTAGNPFHTISRDGQVAWSVGTISGIYKIASADEQSKYSGLVLETDAAVNPGSDGGPLFDGNGRLLGILSLCFCESRWLGTAVPVHLIKNNMTSALRNVPLLDPRTAAKIDPSQNPSPARAIPDGMRVACRSAQKAMVKLCVKRSDSETEGNGRSGSFVRRLRQRPDGAVTGVVCDPEGYILTSAFNVEGEVLSYEAKLQDGTVLPATLLGRNFGLDIALLKVSHPRNELLPYMQLARDADLKIGRFVGVLGCSEDGAPTQTLGIVSALSRLDGIAVQTDALINYGNSGGPVIDLQGRMVGIAAHVRTHSDWSQQNSGVGFFTQSDKIAACLEDLKASRDIKAPAKPFLGIAPVEDAVAVRGVKLKTIIPNTAAAMAKLQENDVILAVDGMDTHSWPVLVSILKAHKPGDTIEIAYQRGTVICRTTTVLTGRPQNIR